VKLIQILSLALLQGVSEVLPISSSGHLVLLQNILKIDGNLISLFIYLHSASLLAILLFFWPQIRELIRNKKTILYIVIASIPAVIFGLSAENLIESLFSSSKMVSLALLFTAFINFSTDRIIKKDQKEELDGKKALKIGLFQALAIIPGISRSGTSLNGALRQKLEKNNALNFIFLMSIPAIGGALLLDVAKHGIDLSFGVTNLILAISLTFISTFLSLKFLRSIVNKGNFIYFSIYCLLIAISTFFLL
jgi:undecaprenyl-diphosphatase